jgi:hypothetical protein
MALSGEATVEPIEKLFWPDSPFGAQSLRGINPDKLLECAPNEPGCSDRGFRARSNFSTNPIVVLLA